MLYGKPSRYILHGNRTLMGKTSSKVDLRNNVYNWELTNGWQEKEESAIIRPKSVNNLWQARPGKVQNNTKKILYCKPYLPTINIRWRTNKTPKVYRYGVLLSPKETIWRASMSWELKAEHQLRLLWNNDKAKIWQGLHFQCISGGWTGWRRYLLRYFNSSDGGGIKR